MIFGFYLTLLISIFHLSTHAQFNTTNTWALVVGISDYESESIEDLSYAHSDADKFCNYLFSPAGGSVDSSQVKLMMNKNAKAGNIIYEGFQWLFDNAKEGDRVIVYFSGHGSAEGQSIMEMGYLLTHDWKEDNHFGLIGTLPSDRLQGWLESLSVKNGADVWLIVDACRSAKFNQGNQLISALNKDWGTITKIVSSEKGANSFEDKRWDNGSGVFTHYLLNGLYGMADIASFGNGNGKVELFELEQYLQIQVTKDTEFRQIPSVTSNDLHQVMGRVYGPLLDAITEAQSAVKMSDKEFEGNKGERDQNLAECEVFFEAIRANNLVGENGALSKLNECKNSQDIGEDQLDRLENNLLAAIHIQTADKLNEYLNGSVGLINNSWKNSISELLASALTLVQKEDVLYDDLLANKLFIDAAIDYENGNSESSLEKVSSALAIDPYKAYMHNLLGMTYFDLRQYDRAEEALKEAIRLSNGWQYPYTNLGNVYAEQGKDLLAVKKYEQSVAIEAKDPYPLNNLGNVLVSAGQPKKAIGYYQKALDIDPNYSSPLIGLGNAYHALGNTMNATIYYKKAIKVDSNAIIAYQNLAILFSQKNQLKEAIKTFNLGLEVAPDDIQLLSGLAVVYEKQKKWQDMLSILLRLQKHSENDLAINYTLGKLYSKTGNDDAAIKYLEQCIANRPDYHPSYEQLSQIYDRKEMPKLAWEYRTKATQLKEQQHQKELFLESKIQNYSDLNPYKR